MEYSSRGQHSLYPLDAVLGLPARSYSYEIQRRLVKAAVKGPFDEAIEELADALGVNLSKRTAEQIVADASVDFESFYRERSLRLAPRSEEHTSELQSLRQIVCRLLLEKKKRSACTTLPTRSTT